MVTSVRGNTMPAGGVTSSQPVAPTSQVPADIQALVDALPQSVLERFRQQSSPLRVPLPTMNLVVGQQASLQISNVGLGYLVVTKHTAVFNFANSSGGSLSASFSPAFPWNLITDTTIAINGGATVYTASGLGGLYAWGRSRGPTDFFGNNMVAGNVGGLNKGLVSVTVGANLTLTASNAAGQLSGQASVACATVANGNLTVVWYTFEKLAFGRDTLLGALPLQNNSTYATLSRTFTSNLTPATSTSNFNVFPFYNFGATTLTVTLTSYKAESTYCFWSVPSDAQLYAAMVSNSYQINEQRSLTASATGSLALQYNIPQNHYLSALHIIAQDSTPNYLQALALYNTFQLRYNAGSIIPVNFEIGRHLALQYSDYGAYLGDLPGYFLWDGNDTTEDLANSDQAGWIDCYETATPQFMADILSTVSVPVTFSAIRESVVPGGVSVVGG